MLASYRKVAYSKIFSTNIQLLILMHDIETNSFYWCPYDTWIQGNLTAN